MVDSPWVSEGFVKSSGAIARLLNIAMVAACPFPATRGTPIRINRIAEALACRGHAVEVFTYHIGESTGDEPFTVHRIVRIPTYRRKNPGRIIKSY